MSVALAHLQQIITTILNNAVVFLFKFGEGWKKQHKEKGKPLANTYLTKPAEWR